MERSWERLDMHKTGKSVALNLCDELKPHAKLRRTMCQHNRVWSSDLHSAEKFPLE